MNGAPTRVLYMTEMPLSSLDALSESKNKNLS